MYDKLAFHFRVRRIDWFLMSLAKLAILGDENKIEFLTYIIQI